MRKHLRTEQEELQSPDEPGLEISSLIDVCFLLLIYFLVTTTIQPREQDLSMQIPRPDAPSPMTLQPMVVQVLGNGEVVVNPGDAAEVFDRDVTNRELPHLKERLATLSGMGPGHVPRVLLQVDDEVSQQRYVDVLNCLSGAGISDIALAER